MNVELSVLEISSLLNALGWAVEDLEFYLGRGVIGEEECAQDLAEWNSLRDKLRAVQMDSAGLALAQPSPYRFQK